VFSAVNSSCGRQGEIDADGAAVEEAQPAAVESAVVVGVGGAELQRADDAAAEV